MRRLPALLFLLALRLPLRPGGSAPARRGAAAGHDRPLRARSTSAPTCPRCRRTSAGAGQADRGGAGDGRPLPPPGLGRQRGAAARAARRPLAARPGAAPRLPDQQGAVVPARPPGAVPARRAGEAGGANFYPAGATKAEVEAWLKALPEAERDGRDRLLHDHPAGARRGRSSPSPTASSTRASSRGRRSCCARRPPSPRSRPSSAFLEKRADGVPDRTTTTRATWPGWSWTPRSSPPSARTRPTRTSWFGYKAAFEAFITVRDERETGEARPLLLASSRGSRTTCRSTRRCATRSSARWLRSGW